MKTMKQKISAMNHTRNLIAGLLATVIMTSLPPHAGAQDAPKKTPLTRADLIMVSLTAKVEAVDLDKREVTVKGPLGNVVTLSVDQRVKRLAEVKVGDEITADYYIAFAAELREPTAQEKANPLSLLSETGRAPLTDDPGGAEMNMIRAVTTVEGLDRPTQSLTVKGPRGNYLTTRVKNPSTLERLRLGDTIVVTYAEALVVSLEKSQKAKSE
jgi:hypothetical protein